MWLGTTGISKWIAAACFLPLALLIILLFPVKLLSQDHAMHDGHDGTAASGNQTLEAASQAALLSDKRESEFNHHLAGFLVMLAGLLVLAESVLKKRPSILRFVWPLCFLSAGLFVLVFSDTELWPFGPQSWLHTLATNREDLQHKTFAVMLLFLGFIELQRSRERLKSAWAAWVFPVLAAAGSILLLFHDHAGGMKGPHHMETMERIQSQHIGYSIAGFGISVTKGLAEIRTRWQRLWATLWPALMILLGVLLMLYTE